MAAQSQPEPGTTGVEVFSGGTLEGALAAARAAHGPRVPIVRAQRVRRGVRGLLGQVRYDVHARVPETVVTVLREPTAGRAGRVRATTGAASATAQQDVRPTATRRRIADEQGLADVLRALVDAADDRESSPAPEPAWSWSGEVEVDALLSDVAALGSAGRSQSLAGHPALDLTGHSGGPAEAGTWSTPAATGQAEPAGRWRDLLVEALQPAAPGSAARRERGSGHLLEPERVPATWDRTTLRGIGVPPAVLRRLPVEDPTDEPGWRRALQEAIEAVVPLPAEPDADHPIVVSGHGLEGAIAVLRAAVEDGAVPGTISFRGRRRQATPAALVEVLSACARS